ncbi:hypothetical protein EDC01DRAFT_782618 [Geopyxis carbonaria]|nr:hypothetical protein EDC01DRAFT_782618 [Geopyxis carbonaria]
MKQKQARSSTRPEAGNNVDPEVSAQAAQHQQQNTLDKPEQLNSSISRDAAAARSQIQERDFIDVLAATGGTYCGRAEDGNMLVADDEGEAEADGDGEADVEFHWDDSSEVLDGPVKPGTMCDGGMNS